MICHVFKPRRTKNSRKVVSRLYSGRYRLRGDSAVTTVALHVSDKQVAEARLREIVERKQREVQGLAPSESTRRALHLPLSTHIEDFVADRAKIGRASDYVRQLRGNLTRLAKDCGWRTVVDLTADSFQAWRRAQDQLSAKTLNEYHNAVYAFATWLKRQKRGLVENPLEGVEKASVVGQERFTRRSLTEDEAVALLKVAGGRRALYALALYTGLRRNELAKLQWGDLQLDIVPATVSVRAATAKNRRSAVLGLHPRAAVELRQLRERLGHVVATQLVFEIGFPSPTVFRSDLAAAGIPHTRERRVDFHALRHTFGTHLSLRGASPRVVMEAMRHSDMRLTMKTYTDTALLPVHAAVAALPDFNNDGERPQEAAQSDAQIHSQDLGADRLSLTQAGAHPANVIHPQRPMDTTSEHTLAPSGADGRESKENARCRVRTCDILRVKQALYH